MFVLGNDTNPPIISAVLTAGVGELQSLQMVVPRWYWDSRTPSPEYAFADGYGGHIEDVSRTATQVTLTAQSYAGAEVVSYSRLSPVSTATSVSHWLAELAAAIDGEAEVYSDSLVVASTPHTANLAVGSAFSVLCTMAANYGLDCYHIGTADGDTYRFVHPADNASTAIEGLLNFQRTGSKRRYDYAAINKLAQIVQKETREYDPQEVTGVQYTEQNNPYLTGQLSTTFMTPTQSLEYDAEKWYSYRDDSYICPPYEDLDLNELYYVPPIWGIITTLNDYGRDTGASFTCADRLGVLPATYAPGAESVYVPVVNVTGAQTVTYQLGESENGPNHVSMTSTESKTSTAEELMFWKPPMYRDLFMHYAINRVGYYPVSLYSGSMVSPLHFSDWQSYGLIYRRTGVESHAQFHATAIAELQPNDFPWYFAIRRVLYAKYADYAGDHIEYEPATAAGVVHGGDIDTFIYEIKTSEALFSADFDDTFHPPTIDPQPPHDISLPKDAESFFDPTAEIDWKYQGTNMLLGNISYRLTQSQQRIALQPTATNAIVTVKCESNGKIQTYRTRTDFDLSTLGTTVPVKVSLIASDAESWTTAAGDETGEGFTLTGTVWASKVLAEQLVPIILWQQNRGDAVNLAVPMTTLSPAQAMNLLGTTVLVGDDTVYIVAVSCDYKTAQIDLSGYVRGGL